VDVEDVSARSDCVTSAVPYAIYPSPHGDQKNKYLENVFARGRVGRTVIRRSSGRGPPKHAGSTIQDYYDIFGIVIFMSAWTASVWFSRCHAEAASEHVSNIFDRIWGSHLGYSRRINSLCWHPREGQLHARRESRREVLHARCSVDFSSAAGDARGPLPVSAVVCRRRRDNAGLAM